MFRQISRIATKFHGTKVVQTRTITSTMAKKQALAMQHYPHSKAYAATPSNGAVVAASLVVVSFFGLQFWNCSVTANRISKEDFHFEAFEHTKPIITER